MHIFLMLATPIIIIFMAFDGYRRGLYRTTYFLLRHILAFFLAMTFATSLTGLVLKMVPSLQTYPGPDYLLPVCFATLFAVMCGIARSLRNRFTAAEVPSFNLVDRIGGASLGLVNGVVISGVVLILWSLMPFAPAVPADWGRVRTRELPLDSGALMLQFYSHASDRMGGEDFVLRTPDDERETVNEGEELPETRYPALENGWLWLYRHHADFRPEDVERAKGQTE